MIPRNWSFSLRVGALTAVLAVPISYATVVQALDVLRLQDVVRIEMRGNACLATGHSLLRGLQADPRGNEAFVNLVREAAIFDARACAHESPAWVYVKSGLSPHSENAPVRSRLARSMVTILNSIGDRSNLTYDSHPVVLNLGDALAYVLPEAQTDLFDAATARARLATAKLEALSSERVSSAIYDVKAAIGERPALESTLGPSMRRALSSTRTYAAQLNAWENGGTDRRPRGTALAFAMRDALGDTDILIERIGVAVARELDAEDAALYNRLQRVWAAGTASLGLALGIAWFVAAFASRREARALLQVHQEASRLQAELARDRAEFELGIREARFQAVFAGSPLAIAITDLHGTIVECNQAYVQLVGGDGEWDRLSLLHPFSAEPREALARLFSVLRTETEQTQQVDLLLIQRNAKRTWCQASVSLLSDSGGPPVHCTVMLQDITDRKEREQQLQHEATHDFLTGLPNRAFAIAALQRHVADDPQTVPRFAVLFMDVDDFKSINDSLGHRGGDDCLKTIALRLTSFVRESDVVTRYGGDEFVLLLLHPSSIANAGEVAARISSGFETPLVIGDAVVTVSLSVGIMLDRHTCRSADQVLRDADIAMYDNKFGNPKRLAKIHRLPEAARPV